MKIKAIEDLTVAGDEIRHLTSWGLDTEHQMTPETESGMEVAFRVARYFAKAGYMVVSGLAKSIETAAHRGALAGIERPLLFLALHWIQSIQRRIDPLLNASGLKASPPTARSLWDNRVHEYVSHSTLSLISEGV